jgi:Fur family ferric uptake transcriptional regulator
MKSSTNSNLNITDLFTAYLEKNNLRKTSERFSILDEIYSRKDHFDAEALYIDLKNKNIGVSKATVYNTLDLLVSCNLIVKHSFDNNQALYEKSHNYMQHDHVVCQVCKEVTEFCDPRIQQITSKIKDLLTFNITHHSLVVYGVCKKCKKTKDN